ncbi:MAG: Sulfate/thiosulfate import ATP-binding protein CysA [Chlamydiia bacterium]|nr:Sulfate/thiosulfate import ATP-binding protein CysA [Chlamydiia bacterium]
MLELENVTFGYPNNILFENLSLKVHPGDVVSILGPSGSGKTTLFKLITSLSKPGKGSILIDNKTCYMSKISYMMQEDLLLEHKTVMGNLLLVFKIKNPFKLKRFKEYFGKKKAFREKAQKMLSQMGLCGYEDYFPSALSKGMRQRVSLARALLFERPYLLLDEPFSAVDPKRRKILFKILMKMKMKYNLTILQITHDILDAKELSDTVYTLSDKSLKEVLS